MKHYSRRQWLSNTALAGSGLLFSPGTVLSTETHQNTDFMALNANENPYGPPPAAVEAIRKHLNRSNRYPFQEASNLIELLARHHSLSAPHFMLGAGSTQLLQLLAQWALMNKFHISYASPTFDILPRYVSKFGGGTTATALDSGKVHNLNALADAGKKHPGIVYIVNPNNPTGTKVSRQELIGFCKEVTRHSYAVIDEAYIEYLGNAESLKELVKDNPRIIIVRTFSKIYALAGLRVGYFIAHPDTIEVLSKLEIWPNSSLSLCGVMAAQASLSDNSFVAKSKRQNQACLAYTCQQLQELSIPFIPSVTNFLYFDSSTHKGDFNKEMADNRILVRELTDSGKSWVRVSMGTIEDMQYFMSVIKKIWS